MKSPTPDDIKEIAEQLDCGFRAYMHTTTGQLLFVPDEDSLPDIELDSWEEELEQIENNGDNYYEFDKWTSNESFEMMSEFAEQLTDHNLQSRLLDALRRNKPFREFKFVIDNSGKCRQQWFDFKNKWQQDFVARQISRQKPKDD
jgi:hypothetical protein